MSRTQLFVASAILVVLVALALVALGAPALIDVAPGHSVIA